MIKKAWQSIDLEGGGLQSVNQRLSTALRRRTPAYLLWLAFALGAHRWYLHSPRAALGYLALSVLALALWATGFGPWAAAPLLGAAIWALADLFWIERRIVALNKELRMRIYLGAGAHAPPGYRGRYTDENTIDDYVKEKEGERAGVQPVGRDSQSASTSRAPSFAEQEAMLRELAKRKRDKGKDEDEGGKDSAD